MDKSALVARYTTSDCEIVSVSGISQVSGVTANDFDTPVDYILTSGSVNKKYTVTVTKLSDGAWTKLNSYTGEVLMEAVVKVNPSNNLPYVAFKMDKENTVDEKAAVITYKDGAWEAVGGSAVSEGRVANVNIDFDAEGTPYLIYSDYTNSVQSTSLKKYTNGSWSDVGNAGEINTIKTAKSAFGFKADKNPIIISCAEAANATAGVAKRELIVSDFNGSSWSINSKISGRPSDWAAYLLSAKTLGDAVYFGVLNQTGSNSVSVYKYQNNTFTALIDAYIQDNADKFNIRDFDLDVDHDGNVYFLSADNGPDKGSLYKPRLRKIDATTSEVSSVGGDIEMDIDANREFALAIAPNGVPFVLYRNENNFPTFVYLDTESNLWTAPAVIESIEADNLSLTFGSAGAGYAAFTDKNDNLVVYKFE